MTRSYRATVLGSPVVLCFLAIVGFSIKGESQELRKVYVATPVASPNSSAFVIAKEKGYYRDEGLAVELIGMAGAVAAQALIGRNVTFSTLGGAGLPPILRGAPLRFLFTTFNRPMFWLYAKQGIRSIKDLKGRRVGVANIGSGPDLLLRALLKNNGLDGGRDVTIMAVGSSRDRFVALQTGIVEAAMLALPVNFLAQEAGFHQLFSFIAQVDLVELQGSVLAHEQLIKAEPVLVERFLRASLKGLYYFRNKRFESISVLTRLLKVNEDRAGRIYDMILPGVTRDGSLDEEMQKKSLEHVMARVGLIDTPSLTKIFDFSRTTKVREELQALGWRP